MKASAKKEEEEEKKAFLKMNQALTTQGISHPNIRVCSSGCQKQPNATHKGQDQSHEGIVHKDVPPFIFF